MASVNSILPQTKQREPNQRDAYDHGHIQIRDDQHPNPKGTCCDRYSIPPSESQQIGLRPIHQGRPHQHLLWQA